MIFKEIKSVIKKMSITHTIGKCICECGSSVTNQKINISQHLKTLKHTKYMENNKKIKVQEIITEIKNVVENKEMSNEEKKASSNAQRVAAYRLRKKTELGEEKYKEQMRLDKQKQRQSKKVKDDLKSAEEGKPIKLSKKETKDQIAEYVANLIGELNTQKVYNKPAVTQLVQTKIKKFDHIQGATTNCDQLIDNLDKSSLVNSKYGEVKKKSLKDYLSNIKLVYKHMFGTDFDCSNFNWTRDVHSVSNAIQEMPNTKLNKTETSQSTKTKRYTAFKAILERLDGFHNEAKDYKKLQDLSQKLVDEERGHNKLTSRESENWMDWNDIVKYTSKNWTDEDRLLHALYTAIPPRRLEYGLLLLARRKTLPEAQKMDTNFNYIVTNQNDNPTYMILNKYKTDYKYGQYIVNFKDSNKLPLFNYSKISDLAKRLITVEKMVHKDPFFVNTKGELYVNSNNDSSFGRRVNHVFKDTGKKISVDILRHSFITNFLSKASFSTLSDNTLQEIASSLGHSAGMLMTYRKMSPEKRIENYLSGENKE